MAEAESDIFLPNEEIKLNKFSIGKMISKGSNGAVYLAKKKVPQTVGEFFRFEEATKNLKYLLHVRIE